MLLRQFTLTCGRGIHRERIVKYASVYNNAGKVNKNLNNDKQVLITYVH